MLFLKTNEELAFAKLWGQCNRALNTLCAPGLLLTEVDFSDELHSTQGQMETKAKTMKIVVSKSQNFLHSQSFSFSNEDNRSCVPVITAWLWKNQDLKAFSIFPSGVSYTPRQLGSRATMLLFFQNFPENRTVSNLVHKAA